MRLLFKKTTLCIFLSTASATLLMTGQANAAEGQTKTKPVIAEAPTLKTLSDNEPRPYDSTRDARADVDATLFAAKQAGKNAIIVMGANWCHDSRDLAAHFMTPRFETLLSENFEHVYVDMGQRDRNLDIAADFGIAKVEGTPTIVIVNPEGKVLNLDTAKTWRDAASRTDDDIYNEFLSYAPTSSPASGQP